MLMCPELACCANSSLHFVYDHQDIVFLRQSAETAEECGGGVVVSSFGLDWFDDHRARREVVGSDYPFDIREGFGFDAGVFFDVVFEGVFEEGESGLWPVEGGDVEFVDWFRACGGEGPEESAVEGGFEGEDGELWCSWGLIQHAG